MPERETAELTHGGAPGGLQLLANGLKSDAPERDGSPSAILEERSVGSPLAGDLQPFQRIFDGGPTEYDGEIDNDQIPVTCVDRETEEELDLKLRADVNPLSAEHLATHVPESVGCARCAMGKTAKSRSQRRANPGVTVQTLDAEERPFGAMVISTTLSWTAGPKRRRPRATA